MKNIITAFKEHKNFNKKKPWDSNVMTFTESTIVPPHYAETIEVLLCCNITGFIFVGGQEIVLHGKQVIFIAPNVVHSIKYINTDGIVKVLKINVPQLNSILNIENFLSSYNVSMDALPTIIPYTDEIDIIADGFSKTASLDAALHSIIRLFNILISHSNKKIATYSVESNSDLRKIIQWSENNFMNKIFIDDVASVLGYEKHYFCNKFKSMTGITYLNYLNNLKINHACKLLKSGQSISAVCENCGFENVSYFAQLFKKIMGTTPKKYVTEQSQNN